MGRCIRLFLHKTSRVYLGLASVVLVVGVLGASAQSKSIWQANPSGNDKPDADVFQKASFKRDAKTAEKTTCTVSLQGAVTALVKNGVELSTSDDWDCDGVPDAYDNCVGIANASQADANSNGIGDGCESEINVSAGRTPTKKPEAKIRKSEHRRKTSEDRIRRSAESREKKKSVVRRQKPETSKKRSAVKRGHSKR